MGGSCRLCCVNCWPREAELKILASLAKLCAVVAGVLLTLITLMTCASLIGRNTVGWTIVGDFELSGAAAGAAIALFMPWCQVRRGNIIVDFFTAGASNRVNGALDRFGAMCYAVVLGLLTWRTGVGTISAWATQSGTMMIGFPEWVVYAAMCPPLALCTCIGFVQSIWGFETEAQT